MKGRGKDSFAEYHPLVIFLYFILVMLMTIFVMHPVSLATSLLVALAYAIYLKGWRNILPMLKFLLPLMLITALVNPLFNHQGVTILTYLPDGNPLTMESIIYGLAAAIMLVAIIMWFVSYNIIMTSDKFIYLFGAIIPALSLLLSITLRLVPTFKDQLDRVIMGQRGLGRDPSQGSLVQRVGSGLLILSIMVTWALESAIDTADSMKSRGYGLAGRTSFSIYKFTRRDRGALLILLCLAIYIGLGLGQGLLKWTYFPMMGGRDLGLYQVSIHLAYFLLASLPLIINRKEARKWKTIESKI